MCSQWYRSQPGRASGGALRRHAKAPAPRRCVCCAAALERLDVVAAPSMRSGNPLSALAAVLRVTQAAIEATQASAFGAQVRASRAARTPAAAACRAALPARGLCVCARAQGHRCDSKPESFSASLPNLTRLFMLAADRLIWPVTDGAAARSVWAAQTIGSGGASAGLIASALCPMHGPVVERSMSELLRQYRHAPVRSTPCQPVARDVRACVRACSGSRRPLAGIPHVEAAVRQQACQRARARLACACPALRTGRVSVSAPDARSMCQRARRGAGSGRRRRSRRPSAASWRCCTPARTATPPRSRRPSAAASPRPVRAGPRSTSVT